MRKSVSVVLKNTDFTEGKGSMVIHKVFVAIDNARRYIKTQPGIMGTPQQCYSPLDLFAKEGRELWNGYEIMKIQIEEEF